MNDDELIITVSTANGGLDCSVISVFESNRLDYQGRKYIAILPKAEEADTIMLYSYRELPGDKIELEEIADEEEYNAAVELFDSLMVETDSSDIH